MLSLRDIPLEKLRNDELQEELPEIYALKNVIENNSWHNHESVFDHTLNVISELGLIIRKCNSRIHTYLNQTIDENTQGGLLFVGALYHDIGKKDTMLKEQDTTSCPKHEEMGAAIVEPILNRFFLSDLEQRIVINIIKYHDELHRIVNPSNKELGEQYAKFISDHSDCAIELSLLAMADTAVSYLKHTNPEEYNFRISFYKDILNHY